MTSQASMNTSRTSVTAPVPNGVADEIMSARESPSAIVTLSSTPASTIEQNAWDTTVAPQPTAKNRAPNPANAINASVAGTTCHGTTRDCRPSSSMNNRRLRAHDHAGPSNGDRDARMRAITAAAGGASPEWDRSPASNAASRCPSGVSSVKRSIVSSR